MEILAPSNSLTSIAQEKKKLFLIKELTTNNGTVSRQNNLAHYIKNFYERLYALDAHAPGTTEVREECWHNTPT
jgi:hypothetical protein